MVVCILPLSYAPFLKFLTYYSCKVFHQTRAMSISIFVLLLLLILYKIVLDYMLHILINIYHENNWAFENIIKPLKSIKCDIFTSFASFSWSFSITKIYQCQLGTIFTVRTEQFSLSAILCTLIHSVIKSMINCRSVSTNIWIARGRFLSK